MKRPLSLVMATVLLSGTVFAQEYGSPPSQNDQKGPPQETPSSPNDQYGGPPPEQPNNPNDQYGSPPSEQPNNPNDQNAPPQGNYPNDQYGGPPSEQPNNSNDQNAPPQGPRPGQPNDQNAPPQGPPPEQNNQAQPNNQMMGPRGGQLSQGRRSNQWFWHGRWRNRMRAPAFMFPPGWGYRRWRIGQRLPPVLMSPRFVQNVVPFGMGRTPPGRRWVRFGPDLLLVNFRTRVIEDAIYGVFW